MAVTDVGSGPTTRLSIWPERTDAHAGLYGVQAWAANYKLKVQTTVGAWAPGWVPGAPKQYLGVSVHGGAQQASELRGSVAETLQGGWNSALCSGIVQLWPSPPSPPPPPPARAPGEKRPRSSDGDGDTRSSSTIPPTAPTRKRRGRVRTRLPGQRTITMSQQQQHHLQQQQHQQHRRPPQPLLFLNKESRGFCCYRPPFLFNRYPSSLPSLETCGTIRFFALWALEPRGLS